MKVSPKVISITDESSLQVFLSLWYTVATAKSISIDEVIKFENSLAKYTKNYWEHWDKSVPLDYLEDYPDACMCGRVYTPDGRRLRDHCPGCKSVTLNKPFHILRMNLPSLILDRTMARVIYNEHLRRNRFPRKHG